jgi:hypothetical protein
MKYYKNDLQNKKYDFGYTFLGPVFADFCIRLHSALSQESGSFAVRFSSRGGIRLMELYKLYCQRHNLICPDDIDVVYLSRISAAKGCLYKDFEYVTTRMLVDFEGRPMADFIHALMPDSQTSVPSLPANLSTFTALYNSETELGIELREEIKNQHELLGLYLKQKGFFEKKIFLVDVGWHGSAQSFIARAFNSTDIFGIYFGKWDWINRRNAEQNKIIGLSIDDEIYASNHPRCSILHYHHIIEGPLEYPIQSTKYYVWDPIIKSVVPDHSFFENVAYINVESEPIYIGIRDHVSNVRNSPGEVLSRIESRYSAIAKKIYFPTLMDSHILDVGKRSGDMGMEWQSLSIPEFNGEITLSNFKAVLRQALWKQGFVARNFGIFRLPALMYLNYRTKGNGNILS